VQFKIPLSKRSAGYSSSYDNDPRAHVNHVPMCYRERQGAASTTQGAQRPNVSVTASTREPKNTKAHTTQKCTDAPPAWATPGTPRACLALVWTEIPTSDTRKELSYRVVDRASNLHTCAHVMCLCAHNSAPNTDTPQVPTSPRWFRNTGPRQMKLPSSVLGSILEIGVAIDGSRIGRLGAATG
jgi:hypothetical protein